MSEHDEQVAVFDWAEYQICTMPELALMYAVPNAGKRTKLQGLWLKKEGLKAGVPDICFPVARGDFIGLYIEMKFDNNKPTEAQQAWIEALKKERHRVEVCYSAMYAIAIIKDYLVGKRRY